MSPDLQDLLARLAQQADILRLALIGYRFAGSDDPRALNAMADSAGDLAQVLREITTPLEEITHNA